jgi:hypothetical protein
MINRGEECLMILGGWEKTHGAGRLPRRHSANEKKRPEHTPVCDMFGRCLLPPAAPAVKKNILLELLLLRDLCWMSDD